MHPHTHATIKRAITSAKAAIHAFSRIIAAPRKAMPGNCININALLLHLCDFDQRTYRYLVKWLAYPLQHPGSKMQYAMIVNGQRGTGCSLFFNKVMVPLYAHAGRSLRDRDILATFNGWAHGARFLAIETSLPTTMTAEFKSLISSPEIAIERKAQEPIVVPNQMNMVFISGDSNFLSVPSDRRFFVVEAPPAREKIFYQAVREEIENGGIDAFLDFLLNGVDLVDFNQFTTPPAPAVFKRLEVAQ